MSHTQKRRLRRILLAAGLFAAGILAGSTPGSFQEGAGRLALRGLFAAAYLLIGHDIILKALGNIARGQIFDENFLMALASAGALALGQDEEAVAVMLFYQTGEWFQDGAVAKSRASIAGLMDIRPDHARVRRGGELLTVTPEEVAVGEEIVVNPGERVPLDGVVREGETSLNMAALTGESMPKDAAPGDGVLSGSVNQTGQITLTVTKTYGQSTVARILELVEDAAEKKSPSVAFITRFARVYTPGVVAAAALLAVLPPLATAGDFTPWIMRALTFLVISCPCALVLSVPLAFFGGIGGAAREGILVKGGGTLEALAAAEVAVFDKTGTLTRGVFAVTQTTPIGMTPGELLSLAAHAESASSHPVAAAIRRAAAADGGWDAPAARVSDVREDAGFGVRAVVDGREVLAGAERFLRREGVIAPDGADDGGGAGSVVHIAAGGHYAGRIVVADSPRPGAAGAIAALRRAGIQKIVMLTGDSPAAAREVAGALALDEVHAGLLPDGKMREVERLLQEKSPGGKLLFAGDGINDAPVLARADIGVAMGGIGSDAAIEAADAVVMTDEPGKIVTAIALARQTMAVVRQNIIFALGMKAAVLVLGATGHASMWAAVFADVGVSVLAILNALRAMRAPPGAGGARPA